MLSWLLSSKKTAPKDSPPTPGVELKLPPDVKVTALNRLPSGEIIMAAEGGRVFVYNKAGEVSREMKIAGVNYIQEITSLEDGTTLFRSREKVHIVETAELITSGSSDASKEIKPKDSFVIKLPTPSVCIIQGMLPIKSGSDAKVLIYVGGNVDTVGGIWDPKKKIMEEKIPYLWGSDASHDFFRIPQEQTSFTLHSINSRDASIESGDASIESGDALIIPKDCRHAPIFLGGASNKTIKQIFKLLNSQGQGAKCAVLDNQFVVTLYPYGNSAILRCWDALQPDSKKPILETTFDIMGGVPRSTPQQPVATRDNMKVYFFPDGIIMTDNNKIRVFAIPLNNDHALNQALRTALGASMHADLYPIILSYCMSGPSMSVPLPGSTLPSPKRSGPVPRGKG